MDFSKASICETKHTTEGRNSFRKDFATITYTGPLFDNSRFYKSISFLIKRELKAFKEGKGISNGVNYLSDKRLRHFLGIGRISYMGQNWLMYKQRSSKVKNYIILSIKKRATAF